MAYQALYRRWRPLTFEDVVGQPHITDTLKTELITKKVAHAYLFCGTRGTGKTSTAKILSRAINCEALTVNGNPCNECASCKGILGGTIMDVIEIDAASNNGVENIRELRDEVLYTPANVQFKVYIIDEVHMLSTGAFNALLKTLEEPPAHAVFILATTEPHKIPATIQSRCQRFDFRRIKNAHIAGRIGEITRKDSIAITQDAIALAASLGNGSMRDALSILDLCSGVEGEITKSMLEDIAGVPGSAVLFGTAQALIAADTAGAIEQVNRSIGMGRDILNLAEELLGFFRELLICRFSASPAEIFDKSDEDISHMKELASSCAEETIIHAISSLSEAISVCRWAANPKVILETCLIKICRPELDASTEAFAARIKRLEAAAVTGGLSVPATTAPIVPAIPVTPVVQSTPAPVAPAVPDIPPEDDDDIPPFDVDIPMPMQEPPTQEITEPIPVVQTPIVSAPVLPEPVVHEVQPAQTVTVQTNSPPADTVRWTEIIDAIKVSDPSSAALLHGTTTQIKDNNFYIVFEIDTLKDIAANDKTLALLIKNAVGDYNVRFATKDELNKKTIAEVDLLEELISKKVDLGEQMTIF